MMKNTFHSKGMIAVLTDIPSEGLEEIVNDFISEGAAKLAPWPTGTLPDPMKSYSGVYLQPNGNWIAVALLPEPDGLPPVTDPGPAPASTGAAFPVPDEDPHLLIESPFAAPV